ncbi:MAG: DUF4838 domain-containing protein, partial [Planctomycetota bacterium]
MMKHLIVSVLAVLSSLVFTSGCQAGDSVQLVSNGKAAAKIYISGPLKAEKLKRNAVLALSEEDRLAKILFPPIRQDMVDELNHHLKAMSGAALEVVVTDDPKAVKAPAVVLGDLAVKMGVKSAHTTFNRETCRLVTQKGMVLIGGESPVGTRNGVYDLLRGLGCDWIMPGAEGEIIPQLKTVTLSKMDENLTPDFVVRAPWYSGGGAIVKKEDLASFARWKIRMKSTTPLYGALLHPKWIQGGHYWHGVLRKYRKAFKDDPTMLALVKMRDGTYKRGHAQLESTSPKVIDLIVKDIEDMFAKNKWPSDKTVSISVGPNDGGGYSVSPESLAVSSGRMDPLLGDYDQTDLLVKYTNDILERLAPKYPNLYLGWYLYSVHGDYPERYKPHPKLAINLADITQSRYHATTDRFSRSRSYLRNTLSQWHRLYKEQGNVMWYYGYNWNLAENLMPYTKVRIYGQDIAYYKSIGIMGHNQESDKAWSILGPHNHLLARLSWDTSLDWQKELSDYCRKAFGEGGPAMAEYFKIVDHQQTHSGVEAGSYAAIPHVLGRDFVAKARALFAKAGTAAKGEMDRKRVLYFSKPVDMLELFLDYTEAGAALDFAKVTASYDAMLKLWDEVNAMNGELFSRYPRKWYHKAFLGSFAKLGLKHS